MSDRQSRPPGESQSPPLAAAGRARNGDAAGGDEDAAKRVSLGARWRGFKKLILGAPRNPMAAETRHGMVLIAFLAWIGLGADGLSSANYGPEAAFVTLGGQTHLALYLAAMTAVAVFIISFSYNQVIELFPSGGGGYKVATVLIGPRAGLISGAALIVDYVLTIAISIAAGADALYSLLPVGWQSTKLFVDLAALLLLLVLNLRGVKEPIKILLPLFLGFLFTTWALIIYGIALHASQLPTLVPETLHATRSVARSVGWLAVLSLLFRAFAFGGGTYTGIEAVSNNVNILKEPKVATGQWTMLYMAASLAFTAAGLIVLYLLWHAVPESGRTLNAIVFKLILEHVLGAHPLVINGIMLATLAFAAAILFVAANAGFLGGQAVLANMAADRWVPHQFSQLSSRLVTQNGILLMGVAALAILLLTEGKVDLLVSLYSINVFITFTLSTSGLCIYWWRHWGEVPSPALRLLLSAAGTVVCASILVATLVEKFTSGAWMTVLITGLVILLCFRIKNHYRETARQLAKVDALFATATPTGTTENPPELDPQASTAVFLVGGSLGTGMHTLLATQRLFPKQFKNYVFISVGEIDAESFYGEERLNQMRSEVEANLAFYVNYCHRRGMAATSFHRFGADTVEQLTQLADQVMQQFPNCVFFASKLLFADDNPLARFLHNQTALSVQQRLQAKGVIMTILPMKV